MSLKSKSVNSTRNGFGSGLLKIKDDDVWVVTADLGGSTSVNNFKNAFPDRFVQVGVAEQNLVTTASGIASLGKVVFATSFAAFSPGRNWEQIRSTICYNDQPVIVVGSHTGLGVGEDGATHQALEDIALMRVLPNMQVVVPCDFNQAEKATVALAKKRKPAYLRLTRQNSPIITNKSTGFKIGEAQVFLEGKNLVIFSCGPIINEAIKAHNLLKEKKLSVVVVNVHTIKPLDEKTITKYLKKCKNFLVVEDHQVHGGLGSAISELIIKKRITDVKGDFVAVNDEFGESGPAKELFWKYGLTSERIVTKALKLIGKDKMKVKTKANSKVDSKTNVKVKSKVKSKNKKTK